MLNDLNDKNEPCSDDFSGKDGAWHRMTLCLIAGVLAVSAAEKFCEGRNVSLWEQYGPWVRENRVQAIALAGAVFYGLSLLLYPRKAGEPEDAGTEPYAQTPS